MPGPQHALRKAVRWLLAFTVLFIIYASLYPFDFDPARFASVDREDLLRSLSWRRPPRTDLIANLLFYLPFGALLTFLTQQRWGVLRRSASVFIAGAALSMLVECAQFATRTRDPSITDVVLNATSAWLGSVFVLSAHGLGLRPRLPELRGHRPDPVALLLVVAWFAFHAAPFMPSARFVWMFRNPSLTFVNEWSSAAFAGFLTGYLLLGAALRSLLRPQSFWPVLAVALIASLLTRVVFRGQQLQLAECAALLAALPVIWQITSDHERRASWRVLMWITPAYAFFALAPFDFSAAQPHWSFMPQPIHRNAAGEPGLIELAFLYVGAAWVLREARLPFLRSAVWLVGVAVLVEFVQAWQPGKSAHLIAPLVALAGLVLVRLTRSSSARVV